MDKRLFQIVTDSSADLPEEYYEQHALEVVRLGFTVNNVNYGGDDGEKVDIKDFYAKVRGGAMPTTYQVSSESAKTHMEKYAAAGKDVLVIAFSSGLSGTEGSFRVAARELSEKYPERKILVVDSLCASMGEGLLVDYVVKKADSGATIEETFEYAENLKLHICHNFTVENLFHLKRGGRVSATVAVVGTILKIKPVMHMDDLGHLTPVGKAMGRKKSIQALVENMEKVQIMEPDDPIFISHGDCMEDVEYLIGLLKEKFPGHEIMVSYVGSVIGTHSGPGTMALFFKGSHR